MSDTEFDDLFQWFSDHDIDIVNEDDDTDLMDDDALADEGSDDLDFWMMKMMMKILSQVRLKVLNSLLQILHIQKLMTQ